MKVRELGKLIVGPPSSFGLKVLMDFNFGLRVWRGYNITRGLTMSLTKKFIDLGVIL